MKEQKIFFSDVITCPEASEMWSTPENKLSESKIKAYAGAGKFLPTEVRRAGKNWLLTRQGMERVFGPQPIAKERVE